MQIVIIVLKSAPGVFSTPVFLAVMCVLHLYLGLLLARTLPFYRPAMNSLRVRAAACARDASCVRLGPVGAARDAAPRAQCALFLSLSHVSAGSFVMFLLGPSRLRDAVEIATICTLPATLWLGARLPIWRSARPPARARARATGAVCECRLRALERVLERCMLVWQQVHAAHNEKEVLSPLRMELESPVPSRASVFGVAAAALRAHREGPPSSEEPGSKGTPDTRHLHRSGAASVAKSASSDRRGSAYVRASISRLAAAVARTKSDGRRRSVSLRRAGGPTHQRDPAHTGDVNGDEDVLASILGPLEAVDVELLARLEVAKEKNHVSGRRLQRADRIVLTMEAVERVSWLFAVGAREFRASAPDGESRRLFPLRLWVSHSDPRVRAVALIKIAFAVFLQSYTGDVNLATVALQAAGRAEPSLEGEFELFSRMRRLQQLRQAASLGSQQLSSACARRSCGCGCGCCCCFCCSWCYSCSCSCCWYCISSCSCCRV